MRRWRKMSGLMMVLCASALASGCAANKVAGDYCDIAQPPFSWWSDAEIDATPARPLRYIEDAAAIWFSQGCHLR